MITLTGNRVFQDDEGAPSLEDIAVGLGRIPRFVGQTLRWWPVLLHSFVCRELIKQDWAGRIELLMLLHDAHESITGDIPGTWKPEALKALQRTLDERIFSSLKIRPPNADEHILISSIDNRALVAEAKTLAPQTFEQVMTETGCKELYEPDLDKVRRVMAWYQFPQDTDGPKAPAVHFYIVDVKKLLPG